MQDSDAVDEVVFSVELCDIVERHVMEVGIVWVADEVGCLRTLLGNLESTRRQVQRVEMFGIGIQV